MATISEAARLIGVDREKVKAWATEFAEYLSLAANPPKGRERQFGEADLRVLAVIAEEMDDDDDPSGVYWRLNSGEQHDERLLEWSRLHTPVFQEPPEEMDEDWRHGVLLGGMADRSLADVARSYKKAADALLKQALDGDYEPHELDYPILFAYRQAIEVYLKAMLDNPPEHHDLGELIRRLEQQHGKKVGGWIKDRLWDFHQIDRKSDLFRYAGGPADGELWVDFYQLKLVMDRLCEAFEPLLRQRT